MSEHVVSNFHTGKSEKAMRKRSMRMKTRSAGPQVKITKLNFGHSTKRRKRKK